MDRAAAVIVGGVGLVVLVLVAFVWAGPDAMLGGDGSATLAAANRPAPVPAVRPGASAPASSTGPTFSTGPSPVVPAVPSVASPVPVPGLPEGLAERLENVAKLLRFPYRGAALDPSAATVLNGLAPDLVAFLAARPGAALLVRGHTDDSGPEEGNLRLGADRAQVVVDSLVGRGVPATRVRGVGLAASMPIADNTTDDGRAANRRVDIVVVTETAGS